MWVGSEPVCALCTGLTVESLEHPLHGAGAAAAGHGDVELVVVFCHFLTAARVQHGRIYVAQEIIR